MFHELAAPCRGVIDSVCRVTGALSTISTASGDVNLLLTMQIQYMNLGIELRVVESTLPELSWDYGHRERDAANGREN